MFLFLQNTISLFTPRWELFVGAIFVVIILVFPAGIMGTLQEKCLNRRMAKLQNKAANPPLGRVRRCPADGKDIETFRWAPRRRSGRFYPEAGAAQIDHRSQRRRENDAVQPDRRGPPGDGRKGDLQGQGHHQAVPPQDLAAGDHQDLSDHPHFPGVDRIRKRPHRRPIQDDLLQFLADDHSLSAINERALGMLEQVELMDKRSWLASTLSHGERRYLEIGIALATEPKVLLLDEPTAGMSCAETRQCAALIKRLNRDLNLSIVLVEHDMSVVMGISDEILVLNEGQVLAEGTPRQVSDNQEVQRVYLGDEKHA